VYGYLPRAHTDGDIYVFFRSRTCWLPEVLFPLENTQPSTTARGVGSGGMTDASKLCSRSPTRRRKLCPVSAPCRRAADLQAQYDMLSTMKDRLIGC